MNEMSIELYEKLRSLQWLLHKKQQRVHAQRGPMADRTRGQGRIIAILKMQDGVPTKDLSYLLGIRVSSLNELLGKMEKAGYIQREPSEADKRVMLVKLTEKGKNEQQQDWDPSDMFACLADEEQAAFGEYLDRIIATLATDVEEDVDDNMRAWWMREGRERMGGEMFERFAARGGVPMGGFGPHFAGRGFGRPDRHAPDGTINGEKRFDSENPFDHHMPFDPEDA